MIRVITMVSYYLYSGRSALTIFAKIVLEWGNIRIAVRPEGLIRRDYSATRAVIGEDPGPILHEIPRVPSTETVLS